MGSKGVLNIRGWDYPNGTITYTLWQTYEKLLKIAIYGRFADKKNMSF